VSSFEESFELLTYTYLYWYACF